MKRFALIFDKVMIEPTKSELEALMSLSENFPVVTMNGFKWVEFLNWINICMSPNVKINRCWLNPDETIVIATMDSFNEKSASTLKANGITKFNITASFTGDEDGYPCNTCLMLNIPIEKL